MSGPRDGSFIAFESGIRWFELSSSSGIYLQDYAMSVWDWFYVGLYYGPADLVLSWPWFLLIFDLKDSFSQTAAMERGASVKMSDDVSIKILSWPDRAGQFTSLIDFPMRLKDKSHW